MFVIIGVPQRDSYHRYMYYLSLTGAPNNSLNFPLDVFINDKSITQFVGIQKPEEHFYPSSLSFGTQILHHILEIRLFIIEYFRLLHVL